MLDVVTNMPLAWDAIAEPNAMARGSATSAENTAQVCEVGVLYKYAKELGARAPIAAAGDSPHWPKVASSPDRAAWAATPGPTTTLAVPAVAAAVAAIAAAAAGEMIAAIADCDPADPSDKGDISGAIRRPVALTDGRFKTAASCVCVAVRWWGERKMVRDAPPCRGFSRRKECGV